MPDTYYENRMLAALEERVQILANENRDLKIEMEKILRDRDIELLKHNIEVINRYDCEVQQVIAASSILTEAWDNFRVQYQITATKELLETAKEKNRRSLLWCVPRVRAQDGVQI